MCKIHGDFKQTPHGHLSGADYKCDEQRMYNIIAKLGLPCIFIR